MISFSINIVPQPKKRPKVYRWSTVNPSEAAEKELAQMIKNHPNCPKEPINNQLRVKVKFFRAIPKNIPKWKFPYIEKGIIRPSTSPDLDNYVKLILDALNKIVWEDDRLIVEMHSAKYYTFESPRIELHIEELNAPEKKSDIMENGNLEDQQHLDDFFT
ncbi:MAG: RusA family crossover junction endodeoxyribonuclease [Candidatus Heimdallarchaeota archaeon]|nr:RusA family crossover junction endodeoxyribonuclease [Candidatus Heimdallarchaeota archaeon]MDH5644791.1 RusA family crossover junction endodeoxyribonuclease [Candidatus Heimdallarchaeota archaeon]